MTEKKTILIVEDEEPVRDGIISGLNQYGFVCRGENTIGQTLELLNESGKNASVIILDMDLTKFTDYLKFAKKIRREYSGVHLFKEFLKNHLDKRPEVIILSAKAAIVDYYKQAIEARASAFLIKNDTDAFIPTIQSLSLKHAFQQSAGSNEEISRFVIQHTNKNDLLQSLCEEIMAMQLDQCFTKGTYILLYCVKNDRLEKDDSQRKISIFTEIPNLPTPDEFDYFYLHQRVIAQTKEKPEFILNSDELNNESDKLSEFTFVKMADVSEAEISIGFLTPFPLKDPSWYPFTTKSLVRILYDNAAPTIESYIGKMMYFWRQKLEAKLENIQTSARLSDAIHNNFNGIMSGKKPSNIEDISDLIEQLKRFSKNLSDFSDNLVRILESGQSKRQHESFKRLSEIVQKVNTVNLSNRVTIELKNDCVIPADEFYFALALNELVKWTSRQNNGIQFQNNLLIELEWTVSDNRLEVHYQENGVRLSKNSRQSELEEPFSSLHIAKLIIEVACRGLLVDDSDELPNEKGHLFKVNLFNN